MPSSHFKQRTIVSSIAILLLLFCIYYSHAPVFRPFFALFNAIVIGFALKEYFQLTEHKGFQPLIYTGILCAVMYVFAVFLATTDTKFTLAPPFILLGTLFLLFMTLFKPQNLPIGNLAVTAFGFIYIVIPLAFTLSINYHGLDGRIWLTYVILVSKLTDVGAYFSGKLLGKTKLAPSISPKKTVEGAVGGIILALIASVLFAAWFSSNQMENGFKMTLYQSIWLGILLSLLAQFGDLSESLLKRDAGVKDSSHLPGLGGILDAVDSLVFTLPLMYLLLKADLFSG